MMNGNANQQMEELQTIANNAQARLNQRQGTSTQQVLMVELRQVPRVDSNITHQAPPCAPEPHIPSRLTGIPTARRHSRRNRTTQPLQQHIPSHSKDQPTSSTTSTEHLLQGLCGRRPTPRSMPISTHLGKPWEDMAGQRCCQNTQLAASPTKGGTGR